MPRKAKSSAAKINIAKNNTVKTDEADDYKPRTPLGKKLMAIRKKIVASGERLLTLEEIEHEIEVSRGEFE